MDNSLRQFAPLFAPDHYSDDERYLLKPFFTNLDQSVYAVLISSPELVGALLSRASRAGGDLRKIFLEEFIKPFIFPIREEADTDKMWQDKLEHADDLKSYIDFFNEHSFLEVFANERARSFYIKWLAQFGDDSIAQLAGLHLVFTGISQLTIKHFENMRIGIAPIEKSTRYVNYSDKINDHYRYYTDPSLVELGLAEEYEEVMDNLFATYTDLMPKLITWLSAKFPDEKPSVVEKKAFDTLRGLLPSSTLSQVAFFANGQAYKYLMDRSWAHDQLGEIRWAAERAYEELSLVAPSFFRHVTEDISHDYQCYLAGKSKRMKPHADKIASAIPCPPTSKEPKDELVKVKLVNYDPEGQENVITAMIYDSSGYHGSWTDTFDQIKQKSEAEKDEMITDYLRGRTVKWMKVGRALENAYVRFEIIINIGAWRDLRRHRMLTLITQSFSVYLGYDVPPELIDSGLDGDYRQALGRVGVLYDKFDQANYADLAQLATCLAHLVRFMQYKNIRECFWEGELRTVSEGHPDYRLIEQLIFHELEKVYPLITKHMLVNLNNYDFARRGQEDKIAKKMESLIKTN